MRILLRCRNCERRYQVAEDKIGRKFRCHCGAAIHVEEPKSHESPVVRCSACGGSREGDQTQCGFCGSDFTLHERDLHTVCAACLTRVSDRARFCHSCGERLEAESVGGEDPPWNCPACGDKSVLKSRRLGQEKISVAECQLCAGLWVGHGSFEQLTALAARQAELMRGTQQSPPAPVVAKPNPEAARYRKCVQCGELMWRRNFFRRSGVVVDVCREHGIWFDDGELAQLLEWLSKGGHHIAEPLPPPEAARPSPTPRPIMTTEADPFDSLTGWLGRHHDLSIVDILLTAIRLLD